MRASRDTAAGRAYLDLQAKAKMEGQPTAALLTLYALEGFLARLAASGHSDKLVLKGGVLLAAFLVRRPTRDVDLQAQAVPNDTDSVLDLVRGIAAGTPVGGDDGLVFDAEDAKAEVIRDEDAYSGVRVSLKATLHTARITFHVDVNVGDPIWPAPEQVALPRLLGGSVALRGYPMPMVHAEKLVTAIARGTANTRWRDFGDVYVLSGTHAVTAVDLHAAMTTVAAHRQVQLQPLKDVLEGYELIAQTKYAAWRRKHSRDELPEQFADLLDAVIAFADPVLTDGATGGTWQPARRGWQ
ncbi:nucleotidyl transferase AbiEii/AbiGii toxin family protein [Blastococcus sp. PRF04-17]|uniref:nucleotidyl transferase AbiEii/AbiGii toxin family protein n=1 Tax=Blastococcus sp. PRF04-17 TaxID=2933797 RepID=UPI001FF5B16D|nr:nucleotidyl transferase AbiEii/AbiGii toxin family protein [Blastococcus sp. PRF04-17]UOX99989.1 nucleotidyl transferase AbiEii/AbiGii toxin family protein [Blastococcus sp. PRF04-17]